MTYSQEDALYDFLDSTTQPFKLEEAVAYIRMIDSKRVHHLGEEITAFLDSRRIAFRIDNGTWLSRRGYFEQAPFVISPTRLELRNGILIPGHRCVPFGRQELLPQEFVFYWKDRIVPTTTTEGDPKEFYRYYTIFGEEYAPQYVARDNPENEKAYNNDLYDDPAEVSINTLDMRNIYRETSFVPGDRFVVRTLDWRKGTFSLERVDKDEWAEEDLNSWFEAAEAGFENSFNILGPGSSTEEQIFYAYWYGSGRMREVPAYALEEFLYEKTDRIETVSYGIETRFWFAGKEIPDQKELDGSQTRPDKTDIEKLLWEKKIPVSEYVIQSYVRDSLYRREEDPGPVLKRIIPPSVKINAHEQRLLEDYITDVREEFKTSYSPFADKSMGPIRQRVGELHTAVIDIASRLTGGETDLSWLPKHAFIVLSQIQSHAAGVMEDLDTDDPPPEEELEAMDNSLDSMIETYEDIRELIDDSLENSRRNKFSLVRQGSPKAEGERLLQFSVGGTEVWRRVLVNESCRLEELHRIIQAVFGWKNSQMHQFRAEKILDAGLEVKELGEQGIMELLYEYGTKWTVKIMLLSRYEAEEQKPARCVAGAGAAPPEFVGGPLRFRRFISALEGGTDAERQGAEEELGRDFDPMDFNLEACNKNLSSGLIIKGRGLDR
ncbi:MAG: plasmid pRiA4b ORF-3 family protein [Treponema sp.]|nr:plasmid pRiA4b ORF-3 family protein [Treponema sp.]